jgi:hypothetical protein
MLLRDSTLQSCHIKIIVSLNCEMTLKMLFITHRKYYISIEDTSVINVKKNK